MVLRWESQRELFLHLLMKIENVEFLKWFKIGLKKLFLNGWSEAMQGVVHLRPPRGQWSLHVFSAEESIFCAESQAPRNLPPTSKHLSFSLSNNLACAHIAPKAMTLTGRFTFTLKASLLWSAHVHRWAWIHPKLSCCYKVLLIKCIKITYKTQIWEKVIN